MKKYLLMAVVIVLSMTSCSNGFKSVETEIWPNLVKYTAQADDGSIVVGLRDLRDNTLPTLIPPEEGYQDIQAGYYWLIAVKDGTYSLLDMDCNLIQRGDSIECHDKYVLIVDKKQKFFYSVGRKLLGPAEDFVYLSNFNIVFVGDGNGFRACDASSGLSLMEQKYKQVLLVCDCNDEAFYVKDGENFYRIIRGKKADKPVKQADLQLMKTSAERFGGVWPKDSCGMVFVDELR